MSKPTKRFVLVPADVYFNQGEEKAINGGLIAQPSVATSESKRAKFSEQDLKQELIKEEILRITFGGDHKSQSTRCSRSTCAVES